MKRFLKDSESASFSFPDKFKDDFSTVMVPERQDLGSLKDTLMPSQFELPSKHTRDVFDSDEEELLQNLISQLNHVELDKVIVNSVFLKYKYIILRGRKYNSSDKREHSACIMQARWNINNYGRSFQKTTDQNLMSGQLKFIII